MKATPIKPVRCAIYTRVSTDQGLDQEFNESPAFSFRFYATDNSSNQPGNADDGRADNASHGLQRFALLLVDGDQRDRCH